MNATMPDLAPSDFTALVHKFEMYRWIGDNFGKYDGAANFVLQHYKLDKGTSWIEYSAALNALAQSLFINISLDKPFNEFKRNTTQTLPDIKLFQAAYCHLLAAKLLHAKLCS